MRVLPDGASDSAFNPVYEFGVSGVVNASESRLQAICGADLVRFLKMGSSLKW
jgi:hypothetical protein